MKKINLTLFCLSLFVICMMTSCKNILSEDYKSTATSSASFKFPDDISARLIAARDAVGGGDSTSSYSVNILVTGKRYSRSKSELFAKAEEINNKTFTIDGVKISDVVKASVTITYDGISLFSGESDEIEIAEDSSKNNLKVTLKSNAAPFEIRCYYSDAPATYYTASDTLVPYRLKDATETAAATTLTFAIFKDGVQYTGSDFTVTWKKGNSEITSESTNFTLAENGLSFTASTRSFNTAIANTVSCSITKDLYSADLTPLSFTFIEDLDTYNRYLLMRKYTNNSNFVTTYYYDVFDSAGSEEKSLSDDSTTGNALKSISITSGSGTVGMDWANLNLYQLESSSTDSTTTTKLTVYPYLLSSHTYNTTTSEINLSSLTSIKNLDFISAYNSNIALYPKGCYTVQTNDSSQKTSLPFYYCKANGNPVSISVQNAVTGYSDTYIAGLSVQKDGIYVLAASNNTKSDYYFFPSVFSILKYPLDASSSSVPKVLDVTSIIPAGTDAEGNIISHATIKDAAIHGDYLYVIGGYHLPRFYSGSDSKGCLTRGFMFRVNLSNFSVDNSFGTSGLAGYEAYSSSATTLAMTNEDSNFYYPVRFVAVTPKKLVIVDDGGYGEGSSGIKKKRLVTYTFETSKLSAEDITSDETFFLNTHSDCSFTDNY